MIFFKYMIRKWKNRGKNPYHMVLKFCLARVFPWYLKMAHGNERIIRITKNTFFSFFENSNIPIMVIPFVIKLKVG